MVRVLNLNRGDSYLFVSKPQWLRDGWMCSVLAVCLFYDVPTTGPQHMVSTPEMCVEEVKAEEAGLKCPQRLHVVQFEVF